MRSDRGFARTCALLLVTLLSVSACASIPTSSDPKAVKRVEEDKNDTTVPSPDKGLGPLALVRSFLEASAVPDKNYAAARKHLAAEVSDSWKPPRELLIVTGVNTLPLPPPPEASDRVSVVGLRVTKVGRLLSDRSFVPAEGSYRIKMRVERQRDGEWRLANPPPQLLVARSAFVEQYQAVPIYFLDHDRDGVVPNLRYVARRPASARPARVIELLLSGPSRRFRGAMGTALPPDARTETNVSEAGNGALVVNFSDLGRLRPPEKKLVAAQVVLSLQGVSNARVKLMEESSLLLPNQEVLRPADVASYRRNNHVRADVPPLAVVDEQLLTLDQRAERVPGPAGSGEYNVTTAAHSADGSKLAAVVREPAGGVRLRVGPYGGPLWASEVTGSFTSRPTWRDATEVWVVVDKREIMRLVENSNGTWTARKVDSAAFSGGKPITDLRISRDGTRVAGVVDGRIVVAGLVDKGGEVMLKHPTVLAGNPSGAVVRKVDWLDGDSLVATTESDLTPVTEVSVNGFRWTPYSAANLLQPVSSITVGPGRKVVVADRNELWQAGDQDELWRLLEGPITGQSIPFYPG